MPSGVFKPYAGVSTAVLFFTKTGTGGTDNVWFYDMKADGYSLDDKRTEIKDNDIPDIIKRYHNLKGEKNRKRTDNSFMVPFADIKSNDWDLSINRYKEVVYEEVTYAKPSVIIQDIRKLKEESDNKLLILEELLK
jgi:type I restriction enzyme M protein